MFFPFSFESIFSAFRGYDIDRMKKVLFLIDRHPFRSLYESKNDPNTWIPVPQTIHLIIVLTNLITPDKTFILI
jgi:hypothetical protein